MLTKSEGGSGLGLDDASGQNIQIFVLLNWVLMFVDALPKYEGVMVDLSGYSYDLKSNG